MNQIKIKRIESQMVKEISEIIMNDARDTTLKTVTITGCEVTNDLSFAKVYFTSFLDKQTILKDLAEASGYIRTELAERIDLRHTPKLKFVYDESIEYGNKIESIINEIHEKEEEQQL